MAEPLKNSFGPEVAEAIAASIIAVEPAFAATEFLAKALDGFDGLELSQRARQIAAALAATLSTDRTRAMRVLVESFEPLKDGIDLGAMDGFKYMPHGYFVAEYGLEDFDTAMEFQYELTKLFTAEFSIRAFYEHHLDATLAQAHAWTSDESEHVRRLVSEGCRPRLPWAGQLKAFVADPTQVLGLLEKLRNDESEYVRRSVANNLNDIAKDHPEVVVATARRWWADADTDGRRMIRHALRTLIKAGNLDALDVMGFGPSSPVVLRSVGVTPTSLPIGGKVRVSAELHNPSDSAARALVDIIVHFMKADGKTAPKVFKGKELDLAPGETATVAKTISVAQQTTRTHYPGTHSIAMQVNGTVVPGPTFTLEPAPKSKIS